MLPRRPLTLSLAALACLSLTACGSESAAPAASPDAWAVVDGREITRDAVEKAYRRVADPTVARSDEEAMIAKLGLLNELITQDLLLAKAGELGLQVTSTEVDTAFNDRKKSMTDEVFQQQLTQRGLTPADVREDLRLELTAQKVLDQEVSSKISVTEQDIVDYYNANRAQFNLAEPAYHVAQLLVTPVREEQIVNRLNDDAASADAADRKVKMLFDRLNSGAEFSDLAMDYSEDPETALLGGDLGFVPASQLEQVPPPLRDAVLKAEPGTVSEVTSGGAHVLVLLVAKEEAGQRDLSSPGVRDNITTGLRDQQEQLLRAAYVMVLRNDAQVVNNLAKQIVAQPAKAPALAPATPGK